MIPQYRYVALEKIAEVFDRRPNTEVEMAKTSWSLLGIERSVRDRYYIYFI
jgi:hypothetical protein